MRGRVGAARSVGGRGSAGAAVSAERLEAEAAFESYTTFGAEVFGSLDLGLGLDASARAYVLNQDFDARIPGLLEARDEWEYGLDLDLTKTDVFILGQFSPFIQVGYSRRNSNLDAFSYGDYRFNLGIRKAF